MRAFFASPKSKLARRKNVSISQGERGTPSLRAARLFLELD
jgi:hypothetical protein